MEWLNNNGDKWDIYNGNPTYVNIVRIVDASNKIVECKGNMANFIIYNGKHFEKIKSKLECYRTNLLKWKYGIEIHNKKVPHSRKRVPIIDKFLSTNFICVTSVPYITSQQETLSNIENRTVNYNEIVNASEKKILEILTNQRI